MLHRADRVAINFGNSFRVFKESEQTVATHIKKIMRNVCVGRRTIPVRVACAWRPRRRSETVHDRHAEHAYIEIECHPHVIGNEREVMDAAQQRFTIGSRDLARQRSRCHRCSAHAVPPLAVGTKWVLSRAWGFVAGPSHKTDQKIGKSIARDTSSGTRQVLRVHRPVVIIATENHVHATIASFPVAQPCEHADKQPQARGIVDG